MRAFQTVLDHLREEPLNDLYRPPKTRISRFINRMRGHRGFLLEVPSHAGMFSPRAANPT